MAYKCIRKLVVVMELLTLILLKVQANDLIHIFFPPSSLPIQLPNFSKLDKVQTNELALLPNMYHHSYELDEVQESNWLPCFKDKIKHCQRTWPTNTKEFRVCVIRDMELCLDHTFPSQE